MLPPRGIVDDVVVGSPARLSDMGASLWRGSIALRGLVPEEV